MLQSTNGIILIMHLVDCNLTVLQLWYGLRFLHLCNHFWTVQLNLNFTLGKGTNTQQSPDSNIKNYHIRVNADNLCMFSFKCRWGKWHFRPGKKSIYIFFWFIGILLMFRFSKQSVNMSESQYYASYNLNVFWDTIILSLQKLGTKIKGV